MASSRSLLNAYAVLFLLTLATALQVSPGSPCASACIDKSNLDKTDPDSSNTNAHDIVCTNDDFTNKARGKKFESCLSCLQESEYHSGDESDQDWFLYNMQYSFNYCVYGYPNSTGFGANPCTVSAACGGIEDHLKTNMLNLKKRKQYDYCGKDDSILGDALSQCVDCVRADSTHAYLANFLVALAAGCSQKPSAGDVVGLSDSVFSSDSVKTVNSEGTKGAASSLSSLPITGLIMGAMLVITFVTFPIMI